MNYLDAGFNVYIKAGKNNFLQLLLLLPLLAFTIQEK